MGEMKIWRRISSAVGGVHMFGPLWVVIHDRGLAVAWRQVVKFDWECK